MINFLIFGAPAIVLGLIWTLLELNGSFSQILSRAIAIESNSDGSYGATFPSWLSLWIIVCTYLAISLFAYAVRVRTINESGRETISLLRAEIDALQKNLAAIQSYQSRAETELKGTTLAVSKIVNRLYPIDRPRWRFTKVVGRYLIDDEGNGDIDMLYHIEAGPQPAIVWRFDIMADDTADSIQWLDQINLRVESLDAMEGKDVKYLLFGDGARTKSIAIFFLPEISAGETRKVHITYKWPGLARDLFTIGKTTFSHRFRTCDPDDKADVEYTYLFSSAVTGLSIDRESAVASGDSVEDVSDPATRSFGWRFKNAALPMDDRRLAFAVTRGQPAASPGSRVSMPAASPGD